MSALDEGQRCDEWCGEVPYEEAARRQESLREELLESGGVGRVLYLEHPPTITAGRHAPQSDLLIDPGQLLARGVEFCRSSRGGLLTYHGPGQLVVYPIVSLEALGIGVRSYAAALGEAVIAWLAERGLASCWRDDAPGVWVGPDGSRKIASVGLHVHRKVAIHGLALNLRTRLEHFDWLNPCGFRQNVMTSLERECGHSPSPQEAAPSLHSHLLRTLAAAPSATVSTARKS